MKKLLFIFVLLLVGCVQNNDPTINRVPYGDSGSNIVYRIVVIDSCEYIWGWDGGGYGGPFLTHKGNCKNPIHYKSIERKTVVDTVKYKLIRE